MGTTTGMNRFLMLMASAMGLGLSPVLPGTCGALLGVAIHAVIATMFPTPWHHRLLMFAFLAVSAASVALTPWAERYWKEKDPGRFVLDEVAGYLLVPLLFHDGDWMKIALWGFFLFRIFDIFKLIPPARLVDQTLHGPWGVLLDDLISAGYAAIILYLVHWFGPAWILGPT